MAATVAIRSSVEPMPVCVVPAGIVPGRHTIAGTRMPPSQVEPLPSRSKPAEPPCVSKISHGPLSEVNTANVFSASPFLRKASSTCPTDQSTSSIASPYMPAMLRSVNSCERNSGTCIMVCARYRKNGLSLFFSMNLTASSV